MGRVVLWQLVVAVIVALIAVPIGGNSAGIASILAGLSCVIPNGIFFLGFYIAEKILHKNSPATFFVMEFLKIAFLVSYIVVLKSYILLLSKSKS